jgi:hypothetical protein
MSTETTYEAYQDKGKQRYSDTPVIGQSQNTELEGESPSQKVIVRYFVGTLTNPDNQLMLEHIMTKSLQCKDQLTEVGDVLVLSEQGTFDKDGCYNIVVKYMELVDNSDWVATQQGKGSEF